MKVLGNINVDKKTITESFQMTSTPQNGYVLTSDADGNGTWQAASGGGGGSQGPAGADGTDGVGITGTTDNGDGTFTFGYSDGTSFTTSNLTGPQGAAGADGNDGAAGATGPQGPAGDKGDTGDTGATGPQGPAGDKGDTGDTGATGPQGPAGNDGADGSNKKYAQDITFTGDLAHTITHSLNEEDVIVQLKDNTGKMIIPDLVNTYTVNSVAITVSESGTYRVIIIG